jgi:uncharacterized protein YndB with AHSA1/START domain
MDKPECVFEVSIASTREAVWEAITNAEFTEQYWAGCRLESDWQVGSPVKLLRGNELHMSGEVLAWEPPHRLSYSWTIRHIPECVAEGASRVVFEIEQVGAQLRLRVTHDRLVADGETEKRVSASWPIVLSNLKGFLEGSAAVA